MQSKAFVLQYLTIIRKYLMCVVVDSLASKIPDTVRQIVILSNWYNPVIDIYPICDWLIIVHVGTVTLIHQ